MRGNSKDTLIETGACAILLVSIKTLIFTLLTLNKIKLDAMLCYFDVY
jgi:hypothetical protein